MALFPIVNLTCLAAVVTLLAAGAGEEGDVGDTAVGALAVCHGFDEEPLEKSKQWGDASSFRKTRMGIKAQL